MPASKLEEVEEWQKRVAAPAFRRRNVSCPRQVRPRLVESQPPHLQQCARRRAPRNLCLAWARTLKITRISAPTCNALASWPDPSWPSCSHCGFLCFASLTVLGRACSVTAKARVTLQV